MISACGIAMILSTAFGAEVGNYGIPRGDRDVYKYDIHTMRSECKWSYDRIERVFPSFTLNHYADSDKYDRFDGVDYTPHNFEKYPKDSHWRRGLHSDRSKEPLQGGICDVARAGGGPDNWRFIRVGPLTSNGGYDWWQFAGHNALNLSDFTWGGKTIGINGHYVAGVEDGTGQVLGYPPIHVHHIHLVPRKSWLRYQWPTKEFGHRFNSFEQGVKTLFAKDAIMPIYIPNYFLEQHGEWDLCDVTNKSSGCFAESLPTGYTNLIDYEIDFEGEINDGRGKNAPDMKWWLEVGVGWTHDVANLTPASFTLMVEDHLMVTNGHQMTYENYYWVPTDKPYVRYYQGQMHTSGDLIRMKHHNHMKLLRKTWFVAASMDELGLTAPHRNYFTGEALESLVSPCASSLSCDGDSWKFPTVVELDDLGFSNLDQFEQHLLTKINQLPNGKSRLICTIDRGLESVEMYEGYLWDRVGSSVCQPWMFKKGDMYTSITFHEMQVDQAGPWAPGALAEFLPMHNQWFMMYVDKSYPESSQYMVHLPMMEKETALQRLVRFVVTQSAWDGTLHPNCGSFQRVWSNAAIVLQLPATIIASLVGAFVLINALGITVVRKLKKH